MTRRLPLLVCLALVCPASTLGLQALELRLAVAVDASGAVDQRWIDAIGIWHDARRIDEVGGQPRALTRDELAWIALIEDRAPRWIDRVAAVGAPFVGSTMPDEILIVVGRGGGEDAFSPGPATIAFDVGRLLAVYGPPSAPNGDRLDRFFDHELTHVLHEAWIADRRVAIDSPLEAALWECSKEGLGNLRSLSSRWLDADRGLTAHARLTLDRLSRVLVERLRRLATATPDEADQLLEGLSTGPFDQKWGALSVALWLAEEAAGDETALARFVNAGPTGVLELARRHLPPELATRLPERCESCAPEELDGGQRARLDEMVLVNDLVVVQEGTTAPWAPAENVERIDSKLGIDDDGNWVVATNTDAPTGTDEYILRGNGAITVVAQEGGAIVALPGAFWGSTLETPSSATPGFASSWRRSRTAPGRASGRASSPST